MSSAAYLSWDEGEGITLDQWHKFCDEHDIDRHGNWFRRGEVEIRFGDGSGPCSDYAEHITLSTFHWGPAVPDVARLAFACWHEYGGKLQADLEVRTSLAVMT